MRKTDTPDTWVAPDAREGVALCFNQEEGSPMEQMTTARRPFDARWVDVHGYEENYRLNQRLAAVVAVWMESVFKAEKTPKEACARITEKLDELLKEAGV